MNNLIQPHVYCPHLSQPPSTSIPSLAVAWQWRATGGKSFSYFCTGSTNIAGVNTACCWLNTDRVRGRHTCRTPGHKMTRQASDRRWDVSEPGWHAGPLIVRRVICLYQLQCVWAFKWLKALCDPWIDHKGRDVPIVITWPKICAYLPCECPFCALIGWDGTE